MKKAILLMVSMILMATGCKTNSVDSNKSTASVVVIGVENSEWAGKCPGAHADATRMADEFRKRFSNVKVLEDKRANKTAVRIALAKAARSDFMIVFYSGHGGSKHFSTTGDEEIDGNDEFLCLYDTIFKDDDIWYLISGCKGKVWLIFDCCHSETMFRTAGFGMGMVESSVFPLSKNNVNMLCWSGCADDTFSYGDKNGGKFTDAFLRNLDPNLTYDEMWDRMKNDQVLKSYEIIKQTKIGSGFDGKKIFE